jgi:hypothetical protein
MEEEMTSVRRTETRTTGTGSEECWRWGGSVRVCEWGEMF